MPLQRKNYEHAIHNAENNYPLDYNRQNSKGNHRPGVQKTPFAVRNINENVDHSQSQSQSWPSSEKQRRKERFLAKASRRIKRFGGTKKRKSGSFETVVLTECASGESAKFVTNSFDISERTTDSHLRSDARKRRKENSLNDVFHEVCESDSSLRKARLYARPMDSFENMKRRNMSL